MPLSPYYDDHVSDLLESHAHQYIECVVGIRHLILGADTRITDGYKWNSMSFRTNEWFATWNQRAADSIQFVFHLGAKRRAVDISDFNHELGDRVVWRSTDRCLVTFVDSEDARAHEPQFLDFVRSWIEHV